MKRFIILFYCIFWISQPANAWVNVVTDVVTGAFGSATKAYIGAKAVNAAERLGEQAIPSAEVVAKEGVQATKEVAMETVPATERVVKEGIHAAERIAKVTSYSVCRGLLILKLMDRHNQIVDIVTALPKAGFDLSSLLHTDVLVKAAAVGGATVMTVKMLKKMKDSYSKKQVRHNLDKDQYLMEGSDLTRSDFDFQSMNSIEGVAFNGAKLTGAQVRVLVRLGANLSAALVANEDIQGANLCGAQLCRADLTDTDLTRTDLSNANLESVDFCGAKLRRAVLKGANLCHADFTGADLSWADLRGADITGALFKNTKLDNTLFSEDFNTEVMKDFNTEVMNREGVDNDVPLPENMPITLRNVATGLYLSLNQDKTDSMNQVVQAGAYSNSKTFSLIPSGENGLYIIRSEKDVKKNLHVQHGHTKNGSPLVVYRTKYNKNEQFFFEPTDCNGQRCFRIISASTNKFLAVRAPFKHGSVVQIWDHQDNDRQKWMIESADNIEVNHETEVNHDMSALTNVSIAFKNFETGLYLSLRHNQTGNMSQVVQSGPDSKSKVFSLVPVGKKGLYIIRSAKDPKKNLHLRHGYTGNATPLVSYWTKYNQNELFSFEPVDCDGERCFRIVSAAAKKALDVRSPFKKNCMVQIWDHQYSDRQKWILEVLD
ncbi:MAG: pentapeptide repeat-containing protein [Zetaproteobacteria bacterium]|nr:pentapeptide repeat-containing protein [Zetaproteobacteria bacterium]